jgi:hypothetical protein
MLLSARIPTSSTVIAVLTLVCKQKDHIWV